MRNVNSSAYQNTSTAISSMVNIDGSKILLSQINILEQRMARIHEQAANDLRIIRWPRGQGEARKGLSDTSATI